MHSLQIDRDNWKALACYLANVHCANAERAFFLSSTPRSERLRQVDIMTTYLASLRAGALVQRHGHGAPIESVIDRLEHCQTMADQKLDNQSNLC